MEERTEVKLTTEQVDALLVLIDNELDIPDNFWDEENQVTFHWEGAKRVCMSLQRLIDKYLCETHR